MTHTKTPASGQSDGAGRQPYHHGDLRNALVTAALDIAAARGLDQVTVREAGKRAGVSPAAPFRHFPTKAALMTAVAEVAMRRLRAGIDSALAAARDHDPLARLRAIGVAYLRWAAANPTEFEVISTRRAIDFDASPTLTGLNDEIRQIMVDTLQQCADAGQLRDIDLANLPLQARALMYGLARMCVDGQFAQWGGAANAEALMLQGLDTFIDMLASDRAAAER